MRRRNLASLAAIALLSGCGRAPDAAAGAATVVTDAAGWSSIGGDSDEQYFSALADIDRTNVGKLGLAWFYDLDTTRGQEATPFVIDGVLYTTTAWSKVAAFDAVTGKQLWQYDPKVPGDIGIKLCCDVVNRGAAYLDGRIYSATLDGRLIALDAKTGKLAWSIDTLDKPWPYSITGAPRVAKGLIFIGNGGADLGARGYVTAYDAKTGRKVWRFYTVPGDPAKGPDGEASDKVLKEKAAGTWFGQFWKYGGGGTAWDAIVYDRELDQLYIGVGNGSPWNHRIRSDGKGDNLFLSSIVAVKPDTGEYLWHYQETPGESWDFTATQPIILADLEIDGAQRKVLMQAPKNGFFYVLDRTNGKLISAKNFVPVSWAKGVDMKTGRPIEEPTARYARPEVLLPAGPGAHNWQPMAFGRDTGLVYIPAQFIPFLYDATKPFEYKPGHWNTGVDINAAAPPETEADMNALRKAVTGALIAWDPIAGKAAWTVHHDGAVNGGALATAGGLVFQGSGGGAFSAYDSSNGNKLWSFDAQSGIIAAPMTFTIGDTQYVAVMAGYGGAIPLALPDGLGGRPRMNGRILVFKLGGTAKLPAKPVMADFVSAPDDLDSAAVARGKPLFAANCSGCHGAGTLSANVVPDLRRSGFATDAGAWRSVVIDGALTESGMVSFAERITPEQAEDIRTYVLDRARAGAAMKKGGAGDEY